MEYNFTKFTNRNSKNEERITITKSNSIGFPTGFYKENNIDKYKFVVLFWDKDKKAIGIKFTNDEENKDEKNRFTISTNPKYGGGIIVRSFFTSNGIDTQKYHGRYEWKKINIDGETVFVIELKEKNNQN